MVLVIGGHPRSGTTLLRHLCNSHPAIILTHEFGNFYHLGRPYQVYRTQLLKRLWDRGILENRSLLWLPTNHLSFKAVKIVRTCYFIARYLFRMNKCRQNVVDSYVIESTLQSIFRGTHIVGDKEPNYVFALDELAREVSLKCLIIYRDCRDVVSSNLKNARTTWHKKTWVKDVNTVEKVAKRWVLAIEQMERYKDKVHIVRYEDLVHQPGRELAALGNWLGVNPAGFSIKMVQNISIGKYKRGLTDEELATVMEIAGPTMERLGYI